MSRQVYAQLTLTVFRIIWFEMVLTTKIMYTHTLAACMYVFMVHSLQYTLLCAGILLTVLIIEFLGRKKTMALEFIACMAGFAVH